MNVDDLAEVHAGQCVNRWSEVQTSIGGLESINRWSDARQDEFVAETRVLSWHHRCTLYCQSSAASAVCDRRWRNTQPHGAVDVVKVDATALMMYLDLYQFQFKPALLHKALPGFRRLANILNSASYVKLINE